jgi:hypothetical protein
MVLQQQFFVRNSVLDGWTNGVWNQVFAGVAGAPAQCFPAQASCGGPYTTLATTPVSREKPYLYVDGRGRYRVFVPAAQQNSAGDSWSAGPTQGRSIPLSDFFIAGPSDTVQTINAQLASGRNLLLTPGVYNVDRTIKIKRADTVVLGLGFATLTAMNGAVAVSVADVPGVDIAGLVIDAGPTLSPTLLEVGATRLSHGSAREQNGSGDPSDPTALQDVFFRIGGPHAGRAAVSLEVNSDQVVLDDIWAWRADHGNGVGWTQNTADTGVVVNGDDVSATGLFVEHYQKFQVIWNGENGTDAFFQSDAIRRRTGGVMSSPSTLGYAASRSAWGSLTDTAWGPQLLQPGRDISPRTPTKRPPARAQMHDMLTAFLTPATEGRILNVVNDTGGLTIANPTSPSPSSATLTARARPEPRLPRTTTRLGFAVTASSRPRSVRTAPPAAGAGLNIDCRLGVGERLPETP